MSEDNKKQKQEDKEENSEEGESVDQDLKERIELGEPPQKTK